MKSKKVLAVIAVTMLSLMALTGCGKSDTRAAQASQAYADGAQEIRDKYRAKAPEVTQGDSANLGAKVGDDLQEFKIASGNVEETQEGDATNTVITFVIDMRTGLFHRPDCEEVPKITTVNRQNFYGTKDDAIAQTWQPCTICRP